MHPTNSTDSDTPIVFRAGAKITMTNNETGEKLTATIQYPVALAAEVFTVKIAGSALANTFSLSEWALQEREPALRIWVTGSGRMIYRKERGRPLQVSISGSEFGSSAATVAKLQEDPNISLIYTSEE